jgi:hypothetical protein
MACAPNIYQRTVEGSKVEDEVLNFYEPLMQPCIILSRVLHPNPASSTTSSEVEIDQLSCTPSSN